MSGSGNHLLISWKATTTAEIAKKIKEIEAQKQSEEANIKMWIDLHSSAKQNFEKQVEENNLDLFKINGYDTCVKIFEYKKQLFTKELFESIINDFGGSFYIAKDCRLALCKYFRLNGAIYVCKIDKFLENKGFFLKENIYAYKMDKKNSIDIDDEFDFLMTEYIINYKNTK